MIDDKTTVYCMNCAKICIKQEWEGVTYYRCPVHGVQISIPPPKEEKNG